MIDKLQLYRKGLLKRGKLLEARTVAYCIELARKESLADKDLSTSVGESGGKRAVR